MSVLFITGIDTDIGKTYATGLLARYLLKQGKNVITQKIAQTGNVGQSEDIAMHRKLMGMDLTLEDKGGLTCPYLFKFPASPHLAAELENRTINLDRITESTARLCHSYNPVLLEGVGGLYVPLNDEMTLIDYLEQQKYPLIVVTSPRLGSINHTLMTLDLAHSRGLTVKGIIYNHCPPGNETICQDSKEIFTKYLKKFGWNPAIVDIPYLEDGQIVDIDFSPLFF